ncbi:MAG TPA: hypothetical protein VGY55_12910, partial [Pirellulales bacterium]|nr:hypothetical protein [Pirellulales bacterium]
MPADNLRLSSPLLIAELVLFASSLCVWGIIVQRLRRGVPVVAHEPRRAVPWKGVDLAFILLAWLLVAVLGQQASVRLQGDQPPADVSAPADATRPAPAANALKENHDAADRVLGPRDLVLSLIVELLSIGIAAGWVIFRVRATPLDMGFDLSRIGSDLLLGGATFLATFLPVSLLQEFLTTEVQPYNHPLIKAVGNRPDGLMLALAGAVAVLVAPLAEEFFFRVLVQGCFEAV